jgi:hypothetical protein
MSYALTEIDHLLASGDPVAGGAQYERLGFTVTPLSVIENLGVANRLILLTPLTPGTANFFECMGVVDPRRAAANPMGALLEGPPGVRSMVMGTRDAQATYEALSRDGYPFGKPIDVEREWRLPDGEVLKPAFRVTLPAAGPLRFNFCQYRTLHYYLREQWLRHENGARHLTAVYAVADDPGAVASHFEKVFACQARERGGIHCMTPGAVELRVGNVAALKSLVPERWLPGGASPARYVGFEVEVESLVEVGELLRARGIEHAEQDGALIVAPPDACGNALRFVDRRKP